LNAIDFLLKPIDPDDLESAINKVKNNHQLLSTQQIDGAINYLNNKINTQLQRLALSSSEGIYFVDLKDIVWLEAAGTYTKFQIMGQRPIIVSKGLKDYEELLAGLDFIRVHQSNIVNMHHIKKYVRGDGGQLWMTDGKAVEVSRRKKDEVTEALKKIAIR
jgi:two-component system LytT family response regulator